MPEGLPRQDRTILFEDRVASGYALIERAEADGGLRLLRAVRKIPTLTVGHGVFGDVFIESSGGQKYVPKRKGSYKRNLEGRRGGPAFETVRIEKKETGDGHLAAGAPACNIEQVTKLPS